MANDLMILAFDHRSSIKDKIFNAKKRELTKSEIKKTKEFKQIIYFGLKKAISLGVNKNKTAILCDEDFGSSVLRKAKKDRIKVLVPVEKSGSKTFFFNFHNFTEHINKFRPDYVKVLIHLNPNTKISNIVTLKNLKVLYENLKKTKKKLLIELLITPTSEELNKYGKNFFERRIRPKYTLWAIREIDSMAVHPSIWKLEGFYSKNSLNNVSRSVKGAKIAILGRSESLSQVLQWIKIGTKAKNVIGFAVGRTIFMDALKKYNSKKISKQQAIGIIAKRYKTICDFYIKEKYG